MIRHIRQLVTAIGGALFFFSVHSAEAKSPLALGLNGLIPPGTALVVDAKDTTVGHIVDADWIAAGVGNPPATVAVQIGDKLVALQMTNGNFSTPNKIFFPEENCSGQAYYYSASSPDIGHSFYLNPAVVLGINRTVYVPSSAPVHANRMTLRSVAEHASCKNEPHAFVEGYLIPFKPILDLYATYTPPFSLKYKNN